MGSRQARRRVTGLTRPGSADSGRRIFAGNNGSASSVELGGERLSWEPGPAAVVERKPGWVLGLEKSNPCRR
jgi:hypothetical protein